MESCNQIIISHFDEIVREPEINHIEFLNLLDIENFVSILGSDNLNLSHENILIEIVREYIKKREDIKPDPQSFKSAKERTPPDVWAQLTDAERQTRQDAFEEEKKKKEDEAIKLMEEEAKDYFKQDDQDKIQRVLDHYQNKENEKVARFAQLEKITDENKMRLFKCIRFSHLS